MAKASNHPRIVCKGRGCLADDLHELTMGHQIPSVIDTERHPDVFAAVLLVNGQAGFQLNHE